MLRNEEGTMPRVSVTHYKHQKLEEAKRKHLGESQQAAGNGPGGKDAKGGVP